MFKIIIRSYDDEATDFHGRKIPEAGCNYIYWSVKPISSVKKDENCYPQEFLKECKYI